MKEKEKDINVLLRKADELRALFVLGQRVIPFLEEIFVFVSEIQPLLDDINISIQENLKRMPNAAKQLSKVTEATEMATTEIMDIIDGVVYKVNIIKHNLAELAKLDEDRRNAPIKLLETLIAALKQGADLTDLIPELEKRLAKHKTADPYSFDAKLTEITSILQGIDSDSNSIMMSLQMQDITSQQIAAVNNLLETVQAKLKNILEHFRSSEISEFMTSSENEPPETNISELHRTIAFDPQAIDSLTAAKGSRQEEVDSIMQEHEEKGDDSQFSAEDIDALFASPDAFFGSEEPPKDERSAAENKDPQDSADDGDIPFSQEDIDALFGK